MYLLLATLLVIATAFFTHKRAPQVHDNPAIHSVEIKHGFFIIGVEKFTLRRGTEVYVSGVKGRCVVRGFADNGRILVELPDKNIKPFLKNRITLAPLRKE